MENECRLASAPALAGFHFAIEGMALICFISHPMLRLALPLWLLIQCTVVQIVAQTATAPSTLVASAVDPTSTIPQQANDVTAPPLLSGVSGGGAVELGQKVTLSVVFLYTTDTTGLSFQWSKNGTDLAGATGVSYVINAATAADAGSYKVSVSNSAGTSVGSTSITVLAAAPPAVVTQPKATTAYVGQSVTFTVSTSGSFPKSYQWRKDGNNIVGGTQASYTITAVTTADVGTYSVVVSNSLGSDTSNGASLTVNAAIAPVILSNYPYDGSYTQGSQASLYVSLSSGSSPFTYQWRKNGVAIADATASTLSFAAIALSDAGKYSVVVTNSAGSATSREATITVTPATPPVMGQQPPAVVTVYQGQSVSFYASANGSSPMTVQWQKNGVAIPGTNYSQYSISSVALSDAGSYTVTFTNVAGSVTSTASVLTVNPPVPPLITSQPAAQTVDYYGSISISVQTSGTAPFTYQWKKDGVSLGAQGTNSAYSVYNATTNNSGAYTVVVSNAAGSVTSNSATVTVKPALPPVISQQPVSAQIAVGLPTNFSVSCNSTGTGPLTYQWNQNGAPIPGASYSNYSITAVKNSDAGDYTAVITGAGGAVTSAVAKLTVLPPSPPSVQSWYSNTTWTLGSSGSLNMYGNVSGTPPFTYQWAKDGVPIANATSATLTVGSVSMSDKGTYTITISNDGGIITSPGIRVQVAPPYDYNNPVTEPWLDVGRVGDIVYFLATAPSRIERYDLAAESWLPTKILSDTLVPTAFVPTAEGIYVAYGRAVVRRSLDLSTETPLANASASIVQMFVFGNYLYYGIAGSGWVSSNYNTLNRTTLVAGPVVTVGYYSTPKQISLATSLSKGFSWTNGLSPSDISVFTVAADGKISGSIDSPYHGTMPVATRTYVLPGDQLVADNAGTIYHTADLTYAGSFGESLTDLSFFSDGTPVILRGIQLSTTRTDNFTETGRTSLSQSGFRVQTRNNTVYVFGASTGATPFGVTKVDRSAIAPAGSGGTPALPIGRYSVDDAFLSPDGIVHVLSRTLQSLVRWNPTTRAFLSSVSLRSAPKSVFWQPGNSRVIVLYPDGVITAVPLGGGSSTEAPLANIGHSVSTIVDLGDAFTVNFADAQDSGDDRMILGMSGGPKFFNMGGYEAHGLAWISASRRLYSSPAFSASLQYETITTAGALSTANGSSGSASVGVTPPIRFSPDGALLVTSNGTVFNADLAKVGVLANNILDAAWLSSGLYTLQAAGGDAQVQQWARTTYLQGGAVTVRGTPVRLLRLSDSQLVAVTSVLGYLNFTIVNSDLSTSTPPAPTDFAGFYFGKVGTGSTAGDFALDLRRDRAGVLLVSLPNSHTAILATNVSINADGTFFTAGTALDSGSSRVITGSIAADGTVTGSISNPNLTFSGSRITGSGTQAGFYQAAAVNGISGAAYSIVGPDGRALIVAQAAATADGSTGNLTSAGSLAVTTVNNATIQSTISGTGTFVVTANQGGFTNTVFGGTRDDVAHTDRLASISTRGRTGTGANIMIAGFSVTGSIPITVLIRGIGPSLSQYGVSSALNDSRLDVFQGSTKILSSDNWGSEPGANAVAAAAARLGSFNLSVSSKDAALLATLNPGTYTAQVGSTDGSTGVTLVEVYDASQVVDPAYPKLVDISTRGQVGTGDETLIAGISITGNAPKRVLIRGIGPSLSPFGVSGTLSDPVLTVLSGSTVVAQNDDWVNTSEIISTTNAVGAFGLTPNSKDSCLLITLSPGTYTAQVSGKNGATGIALIEVYEVQN
jgi:hypothetical protein